jgi:peptide/nickel transport system substrate-binding protein
MKTLVKTNLGWRPSITGMIIILAMILVACGSSESPTPISESGTTSVAGSSATPVPAAVAVTAPGKVVSARDNIILVIGAQPPNVDALGAGAGISQSVHHDNMSDPLVWQSGDDQRLVPTTATTGWEQLSPTKWRFNLREGVKFHNGEAWNAQAALPSLAILASAQNDNPSYGYTGGFTAEAVDEFTLDLNCTTACPIFPNTAFFMNFTAPDFLNNTSEEDRATQNMSFGPYKMVKWDFGVSLTQEAYEDYVPAGDHFEFQKPAIREVTWYFRAEPQVMAAMVKTGEADIAWDVGVDSIESLPADQIKSGGSAETFTLDILSIFHPETSKVKVRQAMAHAINCQEMIDALYGGHTTCRGNIIWPGVTGATVANTAPYSFDPALSRKLLTEASYDNSTVLRLFSRGNRIPKQVEVLEAIQGYLSDVGVNVDLNIVEVQTFLDRRNCRSGQAVADLLKERGRNVDSSEATLEEFQAALAAANAKGGASCATSELIENEPSTETLDLARHLNYYLNCAKAQSPFCDPSPGGIQEQLAPAMAAEGAERKKLLEGFGDYIHEQALWLTPFDLPVIYAVDSKLVWEPRNDRRVRINSMTFKP